MKRKTLFRLLSAVIFFAACGNDNFVSEQGNNNSAYDRIPVMFSMGGQHAFTRSTTSILTYTSGESVKVCVSDDGGSSYTAYDYTAASTSQTPALNPPSGTKPYFPAGSGTTVQAYAYYPSTAGDNSTFTIAANQTGDDEYKASDLMYCANQTITKPNSATLNMTHKMVQLKITANTSTGSGLVIKRVLVNAKNSVTFTPSTGNTVTQASKSDIVALTASGTGYIVIPVQQIKDITIKIETGDPGDASTTATFSFTSTDSFVAGYSYPMDITFSTAQLGKETSIAGWNGGSAVTVEVEDRDIKCNPLWYVAPYNMLTATTMATTDDAGYYFVWATSMSNWGAQTTTYSDYRNAGKSITGYSGTWHFPVKDEWTSIIPSSDDNTNIFGYVSSSSTTAYKQNYATPKFGYNSATKAGISESSYFVYVSATERHAIRFLGTRYCSAWKWVISNNRLTVYATLIDVVSNNSTSAASWYSSNWSGVTFGNNDSQMAVQRSFYMRGYNSSGNNSTYNYAHDTNGYLQSATETGTETCWHLQYYTGVAAVYSGYLKNHARNVRLFRDN